MPIQLPRTLKNLNLFIDGRGHAGHVNDITLPKLSIKTEELRAGGMDVPVHIDVGMEKMECSFVLSDFNPDVFRSFGLMDGAEVPVVIRGATQAQGSPKVQAVVITLRGGFKTIDSGVWKVGDKHTLTVTAAVTYYKLTVDGEDLVEIDAINMIRRVNGIDHLEAQRNAIGL